MSGIYIKGMDMPKDCDECWKKFRGFGWVEHDEEWGTFYCKAGKGFCTDPRTKCPLFPVPEHGRLIDADALIADIQPTDEDANTGADLVLNIFLQVLKDAPTVIPADMEDTTS